MAQMALPLHAAGGARRIVVGHGNTGVVEALTHPETWPFRTAVLAAPPRAGKSLFARWFSENGLGESIDDADQVDETALFHRWNRAQQAGTALLLTVTTAAEGKGWHIALPDLASRLGAALHLAIQPPDDAVLADLIVAHAEARGLAISPESAAWLASRCERSHLGAERLVATIDRLSLERKAAPGPAIWREAIEELAGPEQPRLL
jgi:hypothetical protein